MATGNVSTPMFCKTSPSPLVGRRYGKVPGEGKYLGPTLAPEQSPISLGETPIMNIIDSTIEQQEVESGMKAGVSAMP